MTGIRAIGIDPGPTPGLVGLLFSDSKLIKTDVIQCSGSMVGHAFEMLLKGYKDVPGIEVYLQVEKFVISRGSYRTGSAGARTRDMVGDIAAYALRLGIHVTQRSASVTKDWATDTKLRAAGLYDATAGMSHARDAARHAMYTAVHEGNIPNPLSKRAQKAERDG